MVVKNLQFFSTISYHLIRPEKYNEKYNTLIVEQGMVWCSYILLHFLNAITVLLKFKVSALEFS